MEAMYYAGSAYQTDGNSWDECSKSERREIWYYALQQLVMNGNCMIVRVNWRLEECISQS